MSDLAPFGALICDDYGMRCDCCARIVGLTRGSPWHGTAKICPACFAVWYDCAWDTNEDIKRIVLERERTRRFPFPCEGGERVAE